MRQFDKITITKSQLYGLLIPRVGKKKAKFLAFSKRLLTRRKCVLMRDAIGQSLKLTDVRLLRLFGCILSPEQQVLLKNNKQLYSLVYV